MREVPPRLESRVCESRRDRQNRKRTSSTSTWRTGDGRVGAAHTKRAARTRDALGVGRVQERTDGAGRGRLRRHENRTSERAAPEKQQLDPEPQYTGGWAPRLEADRVGHAVGARAGGVCGRWGERTRTRGGRVQRSREELEISDRL
jgi:hypothetical protein